MNKINEAQGAEVGLKERIGSLSSKIKNKLSTMLPATSGHEYYRGFAEGLDRAHSMVDEAGDVLTDVKNFCNEYCYYSVTDDSNVVKPCSVCPLKDYTFGPGGFDEELFEEKQMAIARKEAQRTMRRMQAQGQATLAAESIPMRRGSGGLIEVDGDG